MKDPSLFPAERAEEARYLKHHNDKDNIDYINHMDTFIARYVKPLKTVKTVLDFGSGPYPMLQKRLQKAGYKPTIYDPFFHPDLSYQNHPYDLIILHEVIEHLHHPKAVLKTLLPLLHSGGYLLVHTKFKPRDIALQNWWYTRDVTHVAFYNEDVFAYIASTYHLTIHYTNHIDIIVFQKP